MLFLVFPVTGRQILSDRTVGFRAPEPSDDGAASMHARYGASAADRSPDAAVALGSAADTFYDAAVQVASSLAPPTLVEVLHAVVTGYHVFDPDGPLDPRDPATRPASRSRGWSRVAEADPAGRTDAQIAALVFQGRFDQIHAGDDRCYWLMEDNDYSDDAEGSYDGDGDDEWLADDD